jgi:hypothetical protein
VRFWATSGRILVVGVGYVLSGFIVALIAGYIGDPLPGAAGVVLGELIRANLMIPVNVLLTGVAVVTYAELRQHENGCATGMLAAELGGR